MRAPLLLVLAACGGSQPATPAGLTAATAANIAAGSTSCAREGLQPVAPGQRRLELALDGNPGAVEVTVDGAPRVAAREGTGCAYVELEPGAHEITLRASGAGGVGAHLKVSAENPKQPWWYDVFSFSCGQPTCEKEPLAEWGRRVQSDRKGLTDPCSAMVVRNVKWESDRAPGRDLVIGLTLAFQVYIYKDAFDLEPRDPSCPDK